jgi:hypothetical protein
VSRPRRTIKLAASLALVVGLFAPSGPGVSAGHDGGPYFDLAALPAPEIKGPEIFQGLKDFVADYPYRLTGSPNEILAGQYLHAEMDRLGYDAQTCSLAPGNNMRCVGGNVGAGAGMKVVMGIKPGTTRPDEWIMFIGHYDTVPQTIDGAYDNGAGTNFIHHLAKEFANVQTNRTLVFAFYNGEEEGLVASDLHAKALKAAGQKITAVLGFDMVGIAWPVGNETSRSCLCMFHGANDRESFDPLLRHVNYEYLGFPNHNNKVSVRGSNTRNSDERSFAIQGFPTLRWAGMKSASNYVAYHLPNDTIETIISEAGGAGFYEQGIENTLKSVYYTALTVDNHSPVAAGTISSNGLAISADGSASSDADGPITSFSWDFGDGGMGEGASVQHTYSAPGTYQVTLTVADNLWSQVTVSESFTVTVG